MPASSEQLGQSRPDPPGRCEAGVLGGGCRGKLSIVSGKVLAGRAQLALARRRGALVHVALTPRGRRLLSRSAGGVAVVVKLKTRRAELSLGSARLLNAG